MESLFFLALDLRIEGGRSLTLSLPLSLSLQVWTRPSRTEKFLSGFGIQTSVWGFLSLAWVLLTCIICSAMCDVSCFVSMPLIVDQRHWAAQTQHRPHLTQRKWPLVPAERRFNPHYTRFEQIFNNSHRTALFQQNSRMTVAFLQSYVAKCFHKWPRSSHGFKDTNAACAFPTLISIENNVCNLFHVATSCSLSLITTNVSVAAPPKRRAHTKT